MKELTIKDLREILYGCTVLGCGGGGEFAEGMELMEDCYKEGNVCRLAENHEFEAEDWVGTPYFCGSVSPITDEMKEKFKDLPYTGKNSTIPAFKTMEEYMGTEFKGVVATELGGLNTALALDTAARLGKPVVDGDPSGRCVPELQHTTYNLYDLPICPIAVCDSFGSSMIIKETTNDFRAEAFTRALAVVSLNDVGCVDHPAQWKDIKDTLILETITWAQDVGRVALEARQQGKNIGYAVAEKFDGNILIDGIVTEAKWEDAAGFTVGEILIEGTGDFKGNKLKVWYENENVVTWLNGEPYVTAPDLINVIRNDTNDPLTNPNAEEGMPVTVMALTAPDKWLTEKGIECLGPTCFGYDIDFKQLKEFFK